LCFDFINFRDDVRSCLVLTTLELIDLLVIYNHGEVLRKGD